MVDWFTVLTTNTIPMIQMPRDVFNTNFVCAIFHFGWQDNVIVVNLSKLGSDDLVVSKRETMRGENLPWSIVTDMKY